MKSRVPPKYVGEREWAAAKHGGRGKRARRKLHLGHDQARFIDT
jgi:hypothetical protein